MEVQGLEISSYEKEGYMPLIDFETWRVAVLRYIDELEVDRIDNFQKHEESDEVFVLLTGSCTLFFGGQGSTVEDIEAVEMEPLKLYNVKKGTYHTHTLTEGTTVLIVENQDTTDANSPKVMVTEELREALRQAYAAR